MSTWVVDPVSGQAAEHATSQRHKRIRDRSKVPAVPEGSPFSIGFCEDRNLRRRMRMEDAHAFHYGWRGDREAGLFAIFDGHGGKSAADWCGQHYPKLLESILADHIDIMEALAESFKQADSQLTSERGIYSGTTAVVTLLQAGHLYTANVGDSRAVLSRGGKAMRLTYDHKGCDPREQARVREAGGFVINERVSGNKHP